MMLVVLLFVSASSFTTPVMTMRGGLSHVQRAWERKTLGKETPELSREAKVAWLHVRAARRALGDGVVTKARASYTYYLERFWNSSAVFLTDVCLRLAILEHNVGNSTGARHFFRRGARAVHNALDDGPVLRERGAALYCSWGLHEYSCHGHIKRSQSFFRHAVAIDSSKSPVLSWRRFRDPSTRLYAHGQHDGPSAPSNVTTILDAASRNDMVAIHAAAGVLEAKGGIPSPAISPDIVGSWTLAYAAPSPCASCSCGKYPPADEDDVEVNTGAKFVFFGPSMQRSIDTAIPLETPCRCEVDGRTAVFRPTNTTEVEFAAINPVFDGSASVTYLDNRIMMLRRRRCGRPLLVLERASS